MKSLRLLICLLFLAPALQNLGPLPAKALASAETIRISVSSDGSQGDGMSERPAVSADGRWVAYSSYAENLAGGDNNRDADIFLYDRQNRVTSRVSLSASGGDPNGDSFHPSISADGRYIAFDSLASNLVPGDSNARQDVFVFDRLSGQTTLVSQSTGGDLGNNHSHTPSISGDGLRVAFVSSATNLAANDRNGRPDIFLRDWQNSQTRRISVSSSGAEANSDSFRTAISNDGARVAFVSRATNLVTGDSNGDPDIFVRDWQAGQTRRVSVSSAGTQANDQSDNPALSGDGRFVAFTSRASNLVANDDNVDWDIFLFDLASSQIELISSASDGALGDNGSNYPSISYDGVYVAFDSGSTNLVSGDTQGQVDVFLKDRSTGQTTRLSVSTVGTAGNGYSGWPSIADSGQVVAFASSASNLVGGDTNHEADIFTLAGAEPMPSPQAGFSATPTLGEAPLTVQFTDASSGPVSSWSWDFGDGGASALQNPAYTYTSPGTYTVRLVVGGPGGQDEELKTGLIVVQPAPAEPGRQKMFLPLGLQGQMLYDSAAWELEDNDSYTQANGPLPLDSAIFGYPDDPRDFFSIYVLEPTQLQIDLENHTGSGVQLQLYYQTISNQVGFAYREPYRLGLLAQPGQYYIYIFTESGHNASTTYTLRLSTP